MLPGSRWSSTTPTRPTGWRRVGQSGLVVKIALPEAVAVVGGEVLGETSVPGMLTGVSIDSRTARPGDLFVALRGEALDGHDFVADAFTRGAVAALVGRP